MDGTREIGLAWAAPCVALALLVLACGPRTKPTGSGKDSELDIPQASGGTNGSGGTNAGGGSDTGGTGGEPAEAGGGPPFSVAGRGGDGGASNPDPPGEDAATPRPAHGPPDVEGFSPDEGPWGTTVTVSGSELGSDLRPGVFLTIGDSLVLDPEDDAVVTWTETQIELRIPFPHSGTISVETPEGSATVGEFPAPYLLSPVVAVEVGASVVASVSLEPGSLALALDTDPVVVVAFDGSDWTTHELPDAGLRTNSVRLYGEGGALKAFGLTTGGSPEIVDFTQGDSGWEATSTSIVVSEQYAIAGGPDGAVVWFSVADEWTRASVGAAGWSVDKGPIADPIADEELHAATATSDGSLYLARALDTGILFDDLGAPFVSQLTPAGTDFDPEIRVGASVDDYVTSLELVDRGRGLLVEYCGSDVDPLNVTGTDYRCYTAALTSAGLNLKSSSNEVEFRAYHAATTNKWIVGSCDRNEGTVLTEGEAATLVANLTWPCVDFGGVELDPDGAPVVAVRHAGGFSVLLEP